MSIVTIGTKRISVTTSGTPPRATVTHGMPFVPKVYAWINVANDTNAPRTLKVVSSDATNIVFQSDVAGTFDVIIGP